MKGYKVFNPDWTCKGFQYKVGETFKHDGEIKVCVSGFHFCKRASDCFNYYYFNGSNKVAEIEAVGNIKTVGDISVTDKIRIVKELKWHEVLNLVNTGIRCTGRGNTGNYNMGNNNTGNFNGGDCNTGNSNTGDYNTGFRNMGMYNTCECNTGDCNTGKHNKGSCNTGHYNNGHCNTGDHNTGNFNTGDWNSCDFSTGFFNSVSQPIYAFNKPLNIDRLEFFRCKGLQILEENYKNNIWIYANDMTDDEKKTHPEYKCTDGYLKTVDFKTACKIMWEKLTDAEKCAVCEIPNFEASVFEDITGIKV